GHRLLFKAEDGIRDWSVTGVQTCALPISRQDPAPCRRYDLARVSVEAAGGMAQDLAELAQAGRGEEEVEHGVDQIDRPRKGDLRSEERRGGQDWRGGWGPAPARTTSCGAK